MTSKFERIRELHEAFESTVVRPHNRADQAFWLAVGAILDSPGDALQKLLDSPAPWEQDGGGGGTPND